MCQSFIKITTAICLLSLATATSAAIVVTDNSHRVYWEYSEFGGIDYSYEIANPQNIVSGVNATTISGDGSGFVDSYTYEVDYDIFVSYYTDYIGEYDVVSFDIVIDKASSIELSGTLFNDLGYSPAKARLLSGASTIYEAVLGTASSLDLFFSGNLASGEYRFEIDDLQEGSFDYSLTVTHVPVPAAFFFYLSALMILPIKKIAR